MDRCLVEHLDEPAMNLCLYGFLCIFGIQYMYGKSSSSSLVSIPNEVRTDLWLSSTSDELHVHLQHYWQGQKCTVLVTIKFLLLCLIIKIKVLDSYPENLHLETSIFVVSTRLSNFVVRMFVHPLVRSSVCQHVMLCLWRHRAYSMNTSSFINYYNILCGVHIQVCSLTSYTGTITW